MQIVVERQHTFPSSLKVQSFEELSFEKVRITIVDLERVVHLHKSHTHTHCSQRKFQGKGKTLLP